MRLGLLLFLIVVHKLSLQAQPCVHRIKGKVVDQATGEYLIGAVIQLKEQNKATQSDVNGAFELNGLCSCNDCHLLISHFGCDPLQLHINTTKDTTLQITLHHHTELLNEVVVQGEEKSLSQTSSLEKKAITQKGNKNLADALSSIEGVSVIKSGSGISKPVVHGLFGNRVSVMNNGVPQSGQRWGNDHAPEIDMYVADHLSVVKGSSALAYAGNTLGSVVIVEVAPIPKDPHLHGRANYLYQSNGRGQTGNIQLENSNKIINWRFTATAKRGGDLKAPHYYLTNTGRKENDIAIQLQRDISKKWKAEGYYSYVNAEIGVLRGAVASTTTDLATYYSLEEPFGTQDHFSREINAPRQLVNHHLSKIKSSYYLNDSNIVRLTYSKQWNNRKEFDVRRAGRSTTPSVLIEQNQHFWELLFERKMKYGNTLKTGVHYMKITNINDNSETGRLPLIPNYKSFQPAYFFVWQKQKKQWFWEAGIRYSYLHRDVANILRNQDRTVVFTDNKFHNMAFSAGTKYRWNDRCNTTVDVGLNYRSPEVNELYSNGVHQSTASYDRGDENLNPEKSVKLVLAHKVNFKPHIHLQLLTYYQHVKDFIYLQPISEDTNTIRGAFRFFDYQQADANIYGTDIKLSYEPIESLKVISKFALVRGDNLEDNNALINMPADNWTNKLVYLHHDKGVFYNTQFSISSNYVAKQFRITETQDFFDTPDAYLLWGAAAETSIRLKQHQLTLSVSLENAFNTVYRDYLNRLRYFSDDMGRSITVALNYKF